jgi:hypothetical protein
VLVFIGHDEYWTWDLRRRVDQEVAGGTHLVFLSGNNAHWNARLAVGSVTGRAGHVLTSYKFRDDPAARSPQEVTTRFRNPPLNLPENELAGVQFERLTTFKRQPLVVGDSNIQAEGRSFLAAAGLVEGDTISEMIWGEGDQLASNGRAPNNLQVLFKSPILPQNTIDTAPLFYYTTFFVHRSGAGVFSSGSNAFGRRLDSFGGTPESAQVQQLVAAVLKWMLAR